MRTQTLIAPVGRGIKARPNGSIRALVSETTFVASRFFLTLAAIALVTSTATAATLEELAQRVESLENKAVENSNQCVIHPKKRIGIKCPKWEAALFGRMYVDMMLFSEDKATGDNADAFLRDTSGTKIRTARIGMAGTYMKTWGFKVEADVSSNSSSQLKDAYLSYLGIKGLKLNVGQAKVPFSMNELTSSRHITFIERTTPSGFAPDRVIGLAGFYGAKSWSLGASVHGEGHKDKGDAATYQSDWGATARGTFAPIYQKGSHYLHLGAGIRTVNYPSQDKLKAGFSTRSPFSNAFDFKAPKGLDLTSVDEVAGVSAGKTIECTGTGCTDDNAITVAFEDAFIWNLELAGGVGPAGFKAQYLNADVSLEALQKGTKPTDADALKSYNAILGKVKDQDFTSWYVEGNWWLTGETNAYNPKKGTFGRVKPLHNFSEGGIGAIGVALRYNEVEFGDQADMDILKCDDGCEANAWTLNLTWKPNPYVKFMGEYVTAERQRIAKADSTTFKDKPTAFQLRAMVDF